MQVCCWVTVKEINSRLNFLFIQSRFDVEGATILAEGMSISTSIVRFSLANCHIPDDGVEAIAKAFLSNNVCKELNLSSNFVSLRSTKALEEVLVVNKTLENLDLSYNALYEDNAFVPLLKGLSQNETLQYLDISWNSLCGEALLKILAKSIKTSKLKTLKIEHNRLSSAELKKLAIGLKFSKTIDEVYIADNLISSGDDVVLVNVFKSKSPLTLLSFGEWFYLSREAFDVNISITLLQNR
jgi:Ran GTPase-activating protein (RanGAP) involved in mRNA processing and transport